MLNRDKLVNLNDVDFRKKKHARERMNQKGFFYMQSVSTQEIPYNRDSVLFCGRRLKIST